MFRILNIPMNVGLRWAPQWTSFPIRNPYLKGKKRWSPFYRFDWDFFSGSSPYQRRAYRHQSKCSALHVSFPAMNEWAHKCKCILPLFLDLWPSHVIYPTRGKSDLGVTSFPWSIYSRVEDQSMSGLLRRSQVFSYFEKVCLAHP